MQIRSIGTVAIVCAIGGGDIGSGSDIGGVSIDIV